MKRSVWMAVVGSAVLGGACLGRPGANGRDGTSCTVLEASGTRTLRCSDGTSVILADGRDGDSVRVVQEPAGPNCPAGGVRVQVGAAAPAYVCSGPAGQGATLSAEAAGDHCAAGGVRIQVGDGAPTFVCNGADGQSASVTAEAPGERCAHGGVQVRVGAGAPTYVCNGADGAAGAGAVVTSEPAGVNCAGGGVRVYVGAGPATYVCNGTTGTTGLSASITAEPPGPLCAGGGLRLQVGGGAPVYLCGGAGGTSATVKNEPPGANCALGGLEVRVGTGQPLYACQDAPAPADPATLVTQTISYVATAACPWGSMSVTTGVDDGAAGATAGDGVLSGGELRSSVTTCLPEDADGDGVGFDSDNCPGAANAWQTDDDADGQGDDCDATPCAPEKALCGSAGTVACVMLSTSADNCGACGLACSGATVCAQGLCQEASFRLGDGPQATLRPAVRSCTETCAFLYGGAVADWDCSTSSSTVDHLASVAGFESETYCASVGTPADEDYKADADGDGLYGGPGDFSAWVADSCPNDRNYCFHAR